MTLTFTTSEWATIANGMRSAASKYAELAESAELGMSQLQAQFKRQAQEAIEIAERIEEHEGV